LNSISVEKDRLRERSDIRRKETKDLTSYQKTQLAEIEKQIAFYKNRSLQYKIFNTFS